MQLLRVENLMKSFGLREVLAGVSFGINAGERAALVAPNGGGKTTLLRLILGEIQADGGKITFLRPDVSLGYLPQVLPPDAGPDIQAALSRPPTTTGEPSPAARVEEAVKRFGLDKCGGLTTPLARLSGGERTRLALARLWMQEADLLLLDEPTNHLDLAGLAWLADWVSDFRGTVLVVSHDRYFLDQVAGKVVALEDGKARTYPGNYTAYRTARDAGIESLMARYREEESLARRLRAAIVRQAAWSEQAHRDAGKQTEIRSARVYYRSKAKKAARRGQALERRLERLEAERVRKPTTAPRLKLAINPAGRTGRFLLAAQDLAKAYSSQLFSGASFTVARGEKIGLVGANGSGKTTLLRIAAGEIAPDAGRLTRSPSARLGYLDQHASGLHPGWRAIDEVSELTGDPARARNLLACFLFREDMAFARIGSLSLGERARLALLKLLLSPSNLLLLDEPTNHLDLPSREQVEAALVSYEGAVLLVSHDRYLLRKLCTKILSLEAGTLRVYHGGYGDYASKVSRGALGHAPEGSVRRPDGACGTPAPEDRMLLENQVAILSAKLAGLTRADPDYSRTVEEFLEKARALGSMREAPGARLKRKRPNSINGPGDTK